MLLSAATSACTNLSFFSGSGKFQFRKVKISAHATSLNFRFRLDLCVMHKYVPVLYRCLIWHALHRIRVLPFVISITNIMQTFTSLQSTVWLKWSSSLHSFWVSRDNVNTFYHSTVSHVFENNANQIVSFRSFREIDQIILWVIHTDACASAEYYACYIQ